MRKVTDTKTKIFNAAVDRFAEQGYQNTSMQEIANSVNIKAPSIYKHFESKAAILDEILEYFMIHFNRSRIPVENLLKAAKNGPIEDLIPMLLYNFGSDKATIIKITRIIMGIKFESPRGGTIFNKMIFEEPADYLHTVFEQLIEENIIKDFNYEMFAFQLISFRYTTLSLTLTPTTAKKETDKLQEEGLQFFKKSFKNLIS